MRKVEWGTMSGNQALFLPYSALCTFDPCEVMLVF